MKKTTDVVKDSGSEEKVIMSACSRHCGGACMLKVHVKDGVITRIETDDGEDPQLRACLRGRAQRQYVYAPDRLKFPMKRIGERGEGKFERISWDEALDTVAMEIKRVRDTYGPGAIIFRGGAGDMVILHGRRAIARCLSMAGGYSRTWGGVSYEAGRFASHIMYGTLAARNSRDDLLNSRLIILWGLNPVDTVVDCNTTWYLTQAREADARIIAVDPRHTDTAAMFAQQWIPIRPSTDAAMLLAMAYTMIKEKLQDQEFLDKYTIGFDRFKDYVFGTEDGMPKTPAWAEAITGVPAATIENLAREYATTKPAALIAGMAPGRTAYGEQYHRAAMTLVAMTGNIGIHGGEPAGVCWTAIGGFPFMKLGGGREKFAQVVNPVDSQIPPRKYAIGMSGSVDNRDGSVNTSQISDAVLKGKKGGYPFDYKLLYIMNSNYVNSAPNINKTIKAFKKAEFIVVQEQFMTATAKFADILLPVCTALERNDVAVGEGVPWYGYLNKAIEPLYESKSQLEIATELAARMAVSDYNDKTEDELLRDLVKESYIPDYDEFKKKAIYRPEISKQYVAFKKQIEDPENNSFATPSGKIEIYSQRLADLNSPELPPIPKYIETWESLNDPLAKKYPLQLVSTHLKRRTHSVFDTIPWLKELQPQVMKINFVDAEARGICDGDEVRVFNDRGETVIRAKVTERIMPGVVDIPEGAWYNPDSRGVDRGGNPNVLTRDKVSPGGGVPYNTCLVQVQKA